MQNEKLLQVPLRTSLMSAITFASILFISGLSLATGAASEATPSLKISEREARDFCLKVWFPRLVLGKTMAAEGIQKHLDRLMEVYTPDAKLNDPNNPELYGKPVIQGHGELRKYYGTVLPLYPNWAFDILAIYPTPKGFVLHYRGKNAPPVKSFEGVDILEITGPPKKIEDWKITRLDGFYDRHPFFEVPATK